MRCETEPLSLRMARDIASRYHGTMMRWHYEHGLVIRSCLLAGELAGDDSFYDWAYELYDSVVDKDGKIASFREGEYNLDQINAGKNLLLLYRRSDEQRFLLAARRLWRQLQSQPRTFGGVYWHKEIYPWQIWLDGVYMQGPFTAEYCRAFDIPEGLDDVVRQVKIVFGTLRDPKTGLLYHAYDESRGMRWADPETGLSPHFWGRAMGWFCMAVLDILDFLPSDHPGRAELCEIAGTLTDTVLAYQSAGGMWYQVLDMEDRPGNYPETSCSSMFCYLLFRVVRKGIVTDPAKRQRCLDAGRRGVQAICRTYLTEDGEGHLHLGGICKVAGLGGNPYRDGSFSYYIGEPVVTDDFKGVGPFVLACTEGGRCQLICGDSDVFDFSIWCPYAGTLSFFVISRLFFSEFDIYCVFEWELSRFSLFDNVVC